MRRRLFNIASFISLFLLMLAVLVTLVTSQNLVAGVSGSMHWDMDKQQWLSDPPLTQATIVRQWLVSLVAAAAFAILPLIWLRRFVRTNRSLTRISRGHCASCGYDLRRTPQRCPECGNLAEFENVMPATVGIKAYLALAPIVTFTSSRPGTAMRINRTSWAALFALLLLAGCQVEREPRLCRVVDIDSGKPIGGAKVWMQPYAPIHPFWPPGDRGTTDSKGEVTLSFPKDFGFYFSGVSADDYVEVEPPEWSDAWRNAWPYGGAWWVFFVKRGSG